MPPRKPAAQGPVRIDNVLVKSKSSNAAPETAHTKKAVAAAVSPPARDIAAAPKMRPRASALTRDQELALLRAFDLDYDYGPCVGLTRLQRWEVAARLGLEPPEQIREILEWNPSDPEYASPMWKVHGPNVFP